MKNYQQAPEYLNIGKIVNTQGIKGEVRVMVTSDFAEERFQIGNQLALFLPNKKEPITVTVKSHRLHKQFHILSFEGYPTINDVEPLRDGVLKIAKDDLAELEDDAYYYYEIIGCHVIDQARGDLGSVVEILSPGANDVWVVDSKKYGEILIPYIESVVLNVDVEHKQINVDLPEGLIDED